MFVAETEFVKLHAVTVCQTSVGQMTFGQKSRGTSLAPETRNAIYKTNYKIFFKDSGYQLLLLKV